MKQVYVVIETWYENTDAADDVYNSESIKKIFDNEDKAVSYIKDAFKAIHSWALTAYPDDERLKLYDSSTYNIQAGEPVRVLDRWGKYSFTLAVHYRYDIYNVE